MNFAAIGPISLHFPEKVETNEQLQEMFPKWNMELIAEKTGIERRHIAAPHETAGDLGVLAAERLFREHDVDRQSIDFLMLCTQSPDYLLPTTACVMQDRLGLRTSVGALDFNLGCSGFVYGLSLADGLIRAGSARRVLLITAETYSKYIDPEDRSLRTIFGDAAAATLIEAAPEQSLSGFVFGTDGQGANTLLVTSGGSRLPADRIQPRRRQRWNSGLYMDGPSLLSMTMESIPRMVEEVLGKTEHTRDDVDLYLMHQATELMLQSLRENIGVDHNQLPTILENYGNTVSSTVPIAIHELRASGRVRLGTLSMLVGYGVGYSWAGCLHREVWSAQTAGLLGKAA